MSSIPPVPLGMSLAEFGERLWGVGPEMARQRIDEVTQVDLERLGLTLEMASEWREFYMQHSVRGRGLPTSALRAQLLERCIQLLNDRAAR